MQKGKEDRLESILLWFTKDPITLENGQLARHSPLAFLTLKQYKLLYVMGQRMVTESQRLGITSLLPNVEEEDDDAEEDDGGTPGVSSGGGKAKREGNNKEEKASGLFWGILLVQYAISLQDLQPVKITGNAKTLLRIIQQKVFERRKEKPFYPPPLGTSSTILTGKKTGKKRGRCCVV